MDPRTILQLAHIIILGPALIYIGLGYPIPRAAVAGFGVFIVLYHAFKTYIKYTAGQNPWVNIIHVLFVGPALIAEGALSAPPRYVRELILMLGFAAIGYHGYYLINGSS